MGESGIWEDGRKNLVFRVVSGIKAVSKRGGGRKEVVSGVRWREQDGI